MKKIIFQINGGIGKTIAATAVCKAIKKAYPQSLLIVISGYPDVFLNNPNVHRSFGFGQTSYFYEEHIENQDALVLAHDPYMDKRFIADKGMSLIEIWCEMFGVQYNGEQPELFLTDREIDMNKKRYAIDRPMLVMQTNGGAELQGLKYSWARDIPAKVALAVIEHFKNRYAIVHIRRDDQIGYPDTIQMTEQGFRPLVTLLSLSEKRFFMDSFAQHTAAALNLPSTVLWIANKPEVFGYRIHDNIVSNPFTTKPELRNSYFAKFNIAGDPLEFPYNSENEIFNIDRVIASIEGAEEPVPDMKASPELTN